MPAPQSSESSPNTPQDSAPTPSGDRWHFVAGGLFAVLAGAFFYGIYSNRTEPPAPTTAPVTAAAPLSDADRHGLFQPISKLEHFTNTVGMNMILVPRRIFHMGTDPAKSKDHPEDAHPDEIYNPEMTVGPFSMCDSEVTQTQWDRVMGAGTNPSQWRNDPTNPMLLDRPVDNVSWSDAVKFCRRLSILENRRYRLPSEREWECACRAEDEKNWGQKWCFGDDEAKLPEYGNFLDQSNTDNYLVKEKQKYNDGADRTCTVRHYKPNRWGFYDMHGNVWEWTSTQTAPMANGLWATPADFKSGKVPFDGELYFNLRGGSFIVLPDDCRSANRYGENASSDNIHGDVGFRIALDR